jgi:hypothetical protein
LTVEDLLVLDRCEVVAGSVQPPVVVPVDPFQGRQFDVVETAPGAAGSDPLGLEQPEVGVLRAGVGVVDQPG